MEINDVKVIKVLTPETISAVLLSKQEQIPCTVNIGLNTNTEELDLFQYYLTILLECICCYTDDFRNINVKSIDEKILSSFKPYLHTVGIILNIKQHEKKDTDSYSNYYCRVMLKNIEEGYFLIKKIPKNYTFIISHAYVNVDESLLKLKDLYAIFHSGDKTYSILFSICDHSMHQPQVMNKIL